LSEKARVLVLCSIPPRRPGETGPTWHDLHAITGATHRKYCERQGYTYRLDVSDIYDHARSTKTNENKVEYLPIKYFIKFRLFTHYLDPDSCREEWDWVVWFDADLLITDYETPLEKFFNEKRQGTDAPDSTLGDIILTHDCNGLHATVIMMRRTAYTLGFAWANANAGQRYFQTDDWSDQLSMRFFLATPPYSYMVWFHSVRTLCAMVPDTYREPKRARQIYEWDEKESLALHLSALPIARRIEIANEYVERLGLLP